MKAEGRMTIGEWRTVTLGDMRFESAHGRIATANRRRYDVRARCPDWIMIREARRNTSRRRETIAAGMQEVAELHGDCSMRSSSPCIRRTFDRARSAHAFITAANVEPRSARVRIPNMFDHLFTLRDVSTRSSNAVLRVSTQETVRHQLGSPMRLMSKFPCRRWRSSGGLRRCWTGRRRCGPSAAPPSPNSTPSPNPSSSTSSATQPRINAALLIRRWKLIECSRFGTVAHRIPKRSPTPKLAVRR